MDSAAPLIRSREHMRQVRDFRGLRFGSISPTDIDGLIDFGGKLCVIFELKFGDALIPVGQRVALERLCDGLTRGGTPAVVLVATHDTGADIDSAAATVVQIREHGTWRNALRPVSLLAAIEHYRAAALRSAA